MSKIGNQQGIESTIHHAWSLLRSAWHSDADPSRELVRALREVEDFQREVHTAIGTVESSNAKQELRDAERAGGELEQYIRRAVAHARRIDWSEDTIMKTEVADMVEDARDIAAGIQMGYVRNAIDEEADA